MPQTLITGANKGLGYETAKRLIADGHDVWIGARNTAAGQQAADELGGRFVQLDVTSDASVAAAVETVSALDVLVNNAGISASQKPILETDPAEFEQILSTNVIGAVRVALAFKDALAQSGNPVIVNVSSSLASLELTKTAGESANGYDGLDYPASKSALNMVTVKLANALPDFRVNAVCPGYTATDLNNFQGHQTVEEGAEVIVRAANFGPGDPTGSYFDKAGTRPW